MYDVIGLTLAAGWVLTLAVFTVQGIRRTRRVARILARLEY